MRRADRLFDIIQLLRGADAPLTAAHIAQKLEVTARTIYRDVAALQAANVPVEGAAGIGYVMRKGFDLPPVMFDSDEIEAIVLGARFVARHGDGALVAAASSVLSKISTLLPDRLASEFGSVPLHVPLSETGATLSALAERQLREAIRRKSKIEILYADANGNDTSRIVWPLGMAYFLETTLFGAWCELRGDFRAFRTDRIRSMSVLPAAFDDPDGDLRERFLQSMRNEGR